MSAVPAGLRTEFRSRPALVTGVALSTLLVVASLLMWMGLGPAIRAQFSLAQVLTLVFFLAVIVGVMLSVGLSSIRCDQQGLHVRNAVRTHHYAWPEVAGAELGGGDPWAYVLLRPTPERPDGETQMALAVQRSQGDADETMAQLRATIAHFQAGAQDAPEARR